MKAIVLALAVLAAGSVPVFAQTTLANWNFDSAAVSGSSTNFGPIAADVGTGSATGQHASAATWSAPVGNGSAKSFSSNTWGVGDFYQFQTSTAGQNGISISWDQFGSGTGPRDFQLQYSVDGSNFSSFANYSVLSTPTWSSGGSRNSIFTFSYDLSGLSALNNQASVYFRLADASATSINGSAVGTAGTDRVDNFTISAIPEPSTYALLSGVVGFVVVLRRRKSAARAARMA